MADSKVIGGTNITASQQAEFWMQVGAGIITRKTLQAFLEKRNPFERERKNWPIFGKLQTIKVVEDGKTMSGYDYIKTARLLAQEDGKGMAGNEAFNFYKRTENWSLLPEGVKYIVFPKAQFDPGNVRRVRILFRFASEWNPGNRLLLHDFCSDHHVGVSQV